MMVGLYKPKKVRVKGYLLSYEAKQQTLSPEPYTLNTINPKPLNP